VGHAGDTDAPHGDENATALTKADMVLFENLG
jgi:hypothetical protein